MWPKSLYWSHPDNNMVLCSSQVSNPLDRIGITSISQNSFCDTSPGHGREDEDPREEAGGAKSTPTFKREGGAGEWRARCECGPGKDGRRGGGSVDHGADSKRPSFRPHRKLGLESESNTLVPERASSKTPSFSERGCEDERAGDRPCPVEPFVVRHLLHVEHLELVMVTCFEE